jgi:hypothetical protein
VRRRWNGNGLLAAALEYAALGVPVVPGHYPGTTSRAGRRQGTVCSCARLGCLHPSEHPIVGLEQATTDPAQIGQWWLEAPRANVILATGVAFDVLDAGAGPGEAIARQLEQAGWDGPLARTGAGRWHLYLPPAVAVAALGCRPARPGRTAVVAVMAADNLDALAARGTRAGVVHDVPVTAAPPQRARPGSQGVGRHVPGAPPSPRRERSTRDPGDDAT